MKRSIDLTENSNFANHTIKNGVYKKRYRHRVTPWERGAGEQEPAPLEKISGMTDMLYLKTTNSNHTNDYFDWTTTSTTDNFNFTMGNFYEIGDDNTITIDASIDSMSNTRYYLKINPKYVITNKQKRRRLPSGIINPKSSYTRFTSCCKKCNKKVVTLPWRGGGKYGPYICDECSNKVEPEHHEESKDVRIRKRWSKESDNKLIRLYDRRIGDYLYYISVPCISSDIPDELEQPQYRKYPKRYKVWDNCCDYVCEENGNKSMRDNAVYYKGRQPKRFGREQPWQPKGRVSQDYDTIFDSLDWRKMLCKRIGTLDESLFDNEKLTINALRNEVPTIVSNQFSLTVDPAIQRMQDDFLSWVTIN